MTRCDRRPEPAACGRLRLYLGYAPGAGTTCALFSEGHRRAEHGTDVVVAIAETHGRPHTQALLAGLEIIPPARVPYQGTTFEEIDLGAVLARMPAVALVDDLAHRNVPGAGHARRWQDAGDLLAAGIDVISTVSIGQLESLSDVAGSPRCRKAFPPDQLANTGWRGRCGANRRRVRTLPLGRIRQHAVTPLDTPAIDACRLPCAAQALRKHGSSDFLLAAMHGAVRTEILFAWRSVS